MDRLQVSLATFPVADSLEDFAVLLRHFDRLIPINPGTRDLSFAHGAILYRAGQFSKAIESLTECVELWSKLPLDLTDPNGPRSSRAMPMLFLAMSYHQAGDAEKAKRWWQRGQVAFEEDIQAAEELGSSHLVAAVRRSLFRRVSEEGKQLLGLGSGK